MLCQNRELLLYYMFVTGQMGVMGIAQFGTFSVVVLALSSAFARFSDQP